MADSFVPITAGTGTNVDTRTQAGGDHRQVIVIGDAAATDTAPVDATAGMPVHGMTFTSGGASIHHFVAAATTNAANIKASPGQIYGVSVSNRANYPVYLKLHNTTGTPTAGAGVVYTVGAQAGQDRHLSFPNGLAFSTGLARTLVKGITDADAVAVALSDAVVDIEYK